MSGGVFICIALSDLLPEVDFSSAGRFTRAFTVLAGVAVAWSIGFLEPEHAHDPKPPADHKHSHDHPHDHGHKH